ncbi:hypothetical protein [Nocardioides pinisoli]|uniref:Uncharacterized protein n=1 Tax=Nocardioides pinisoli TaxID=2950279 RepID=A0ABT1KZQ1_9ACTN|nr:hypothetical protein [Nocardioides pinisoli]MCP3422726.1 hypothetical protein [Nocardioides pinisoli]
MQTPETVAPSGPTITVRGHEYLVAEARSLALELRVAADCVELADAGALDVLRAAADVAGTNLVDLAKAAHVGSDPDCWTKHDARRVAVALGQRLF